MLVLPQQTGGNAGWRWSSYRDDVATYAKLGTPVAPPPSGSATGITNPPGGNLSSIAFFGTVPADEMWSFERLALSTPFQVDGLRVVLFVDDDRTDGTQALYDVANQVDGFFTDDTFEMLVRPFPLQVQGGERLGVAWIAPPPDNSLIRGTARAQITTYART